ncbi:relaxase/mobilization nuclease domain-containing protein [Dysgonomonas reticulitermitis]
MIGKIIKGKSFKGCISYILEKENTKLLDSEGVLLTDTNSIINSFYMQSLMNPNLAKSVGHIPLAYSKDDATKLTDAFMVTLAREYMQAMEIGNTQYIIVRHSDREHPHCHIVFNRVNNEGKTISDKNDHFRNEKVTKALKEKYGLTFGTNKEKVKTHRLKEPDKTRYEIHKAIQTALKSAKNWNQLRDLLMKEKIQVKFKYKGQSDEVQGISFAKDDYSFKGSEIDRQFSYSKIDCQLRHNGQEQGTAINQPKPDYPHNKSSVLENVDSVLGGLFDIHPSGSDYDPDQAEYLRQQKLKKKKKRRGLKM